MAKQRRFGKDELGRPRVRQANSSSITELTIIGTRTSRYLHVQIEAPQQRTALGFIDLTPAIRKFLRKALQ